MGLSRGLAGIAGGWGDRPTSPQPSTKNIRARLTYPEAVPLQTQLTGHGTAQAFSPGLLPKNSTTGNSPRPHKKTPGKPMGLSGGLAGIAGGWGDRPTSPQPSTKYIRARLTYPEAVPSQTRLTGHATAQAFSPGLLPKNYTPDNSHRRI